MNELAYYMMVAAVAVMVITPLTWLALTTRRVAALSLQPVSAAWDMPAFEDLDRQRLRMYRLHPSGGGAGASQEIRDDTGKRIGRVSFYRFEPPQVELNGRKFRVYDQSDRKNGAQWRGRVGGESRNSIVLHADGKPVAEIFRGGGWLSRAWEKLSFARGDVNISSPARKRSPFEFRFEDRTVARVVRPDPTGIAPVTYVALASHATPEFAAGVLYLSTQRR